MTKRKLQTFPLKALRKRAFELKPLWENNKLSDEELDEFFRIFYELVFRAKPSRGEKGVEKKLSYKAI